MINAQSSFIPLFFDETEADLWLALQQIEPVERSSFIKSILRQELLGDSSKDLLMKEKQNLQNLVLVEEETSELSDNVLLADLPEGGFEDVGSFSLDALFEVTISEQDNGHVVEFDLESLIENQPIHSAGFEYMMEHIIGTEEDEAVLEVLRGFPSEKR